MSKTFAHAHLLTFPVDETPAGGFLEALHLEIYHGRTDLLLDYRALKLSAPSELFERDGHPWEHILGEYLPRRLRFTGAKVREGKNIGASLADLPPRDSDRLLNAVLAWRGTDGQNIYLFDLRRHADDVLLLEAMGCLQEDRPGPAWKADFERNWSPPPLSPARLIPTLHRLHQRYGGDPVTIHLNGQPRHLRLFVGGMEDQSGRRPDVSAVLNLAEEASRWAVDMPPDPADRWIERGEGSKGMTIRDLAEEAGWVIDHLKKGQRVLVHCSAGMNRSSSVCCAVLILLEGLSAEAALERVREHHPWARPDPYHWLTLRWLASRHVMVSGP